MEWIKLGILIVGIFLGALLKDSAKALCTNIINRLKTKRQLKSSKELAELNNQHNKELEEHRNQLYINSHKELEEYKNQLYIISQGALRYSKEQFSRYNDLWMSLIKLDSCADKLWNEPIKINLKEFNKQSESAKVEMDKSFMFIEDIKQQDRLRDLIDSFNEYGNGKTLLINWRKCSNEQEIRKMTADNDEYRKKYKTLLSETLSYIQKQINAERLTGGLASVGVSVRGHFSGNLEAHRPSQPQ